MLTLQIIIKLQILLTVFFVVCLIMFTKPLLCRSVVIVSRTCQNTFQEMNWNQNSLKGLSGWSPFFFKEAQQKLLLISQRGKEMFGGTFAEYCVPALH